MSTHKTLITLLTTLALIVTGLLSSTPALAATGYRETGHFGPEGTGLEAPGFVNPYGVAVDNDPSSPSFGDVYVADAGAGTVGKFTPTGQPISTLPLPEGAGPTGVAVDPKSGDVYVVDAGRVTVDKFTPTGESISGFDLVIPVPAGYTLDTLEVGVAVDPSNGNIYIVPFELGPEVAQNIEEFTSSGAYISQITNENRGNSTVFEAFDVAVDSAGNVYSSEQGSIDPTGVDKFSLAEGVWKFDGVVDQGISNVPRLAVNPESNDIYSVSTSGVEWHDSSGKLLYEFGAGGADQTGIAVNYSTGTVYESKGSVSIFEPVQLTPPLATSQPVSSVLSESAVFNGSVNPNGLDTKYHVEYWSTEDPEHVRLAKIDVGSGYQTQTLTQVISGLVANTTYHTALIATNSEGTTTSQEQTFTTTALPSPEATTGSASEITPYTATITGTLNPNGIETTYHFDIGSDTNYGAQIYGSGIFAGATPITLGLQDLQPGTTYHYRFVASNQAGIVYGADKTFTTVAIPQAITPPATLPFVPYKNIAFPKEETESHGTQRTLTSTQKLANALKACKKKPAGKRAACQRQAHKRYPQTKKKSKAKK